MHTEFLDKLHCYFVHCYDVGYRLTPMERNGVQHTDDEKEITINHQRLRHTLKQKQKANPYSRNNTKYNNQLVQTKKNELQMYSFGQLFYYWPCFEKDTNTDLIHPEGYTIKDWFIKPIKATLKEELIHNNVARITIQQWDLKYANAEARRETDYCRTELTAKHKQMLQLMWNRQDKMPNWHCQTEKSKIKFGALITIEHLLSVIVYCDFDNLQSQFSATYRRAKLENNDFESDEQFKSRHRNFGWMGRYLDEAVNIFCSFTNSPADVFYHGINQQMHLAGVYCGMYQPFSTSSSWEIAMAFSENSGLILDIRSNGSAFFDCRWISMYPHEFERLFINCSNALLISNITDVQGIIQDAEVYYRAIQIIQQLIQGDAYCSDMNVMKQYSMISHPFFLGKRQIDPKHSLTRPAICGAWLRIPKPQPIKKIWQSATLEIIQKELNPHEPTQYHERMFHHVCITKTLIMIDMELMYIDVCSINKRRSNGYQGFAFMKEIFCEKAIEMINLGFMCKLFPNAMDVKIDEMSCINEACIEYILKFVSSPQGSQFRGFFLNLMEGLDEDYQQTLVSKYKSRFLSIGWVILDNKWVKQHAAKNSAKIPNYRSLVQLNNSGVQIAKLSHLASVAQYPGDQTSNISSHVSSKAGVVKNTKILNGFIKTFSVLNIDTDTSTISDTQFAQIQQINRDSYIVSDVDEELLFLIEFHVEIALDTVIFYAFDATNEENMSAPKNISLFKVNTVDKDFDDVANMTADIKFVCKRNELKHGQVFCVKKKAKSCVKFGKIQKLIIYIKSNIDNKDQTYLNGIQFQGIAKERTDMKNWEQASAQAKMALSK